MKLIRIILVTFFIVGASNPPIADDDSKIGPAAPRFSFTNMSLKGKIQGHPWDGGHGVAMIDVDNDGDLDIYVTNTPGRNTTPVPNYLYINNGKGVFNEGAKPRGIDGGDDFGAHGAVFADFDRDGDFDLLVANAGGDLPAQNRLYLNGGDGYFFDKTNTSGMKGKLYRSRGVAVGDYTGDGLLDYVITNPLANTDNPPSSKLSLKRFYRNVKARKFTGATAGLTYSGFTQGITSADIDGDGDLDLIESKRPGFNFDGITNTLWLNKGKGSFSDGSHLLGSSFHHDNTNDYNGSALADIDNDGDLDLLTISVQKIRLFRNEGEDGFTEITDSSGLTGGGYTASFGDLNNDGFVDVLLASGFEGHLVFQNLGKGKFRRIDGSGILPPAFNDPRGMALGDYDNDGDLDIVIVHKLNIAQLFRNNADNKNFLQFKLTSPDGEIGATGAKVYLYTAGKQLKDQYLIAFREVGTSTGYISQNSPVVHFGMKKAKLRVDVRIRFMDGSEITMLNILPGKTVTVNFQ